MSLFRRFWWVLFFSAIIFQISFVIVNVKIGVSEVAFAIILLTKKVKDWYGLLFEICRKEIMATP